MMQFNTISPAFAAAIVSAQGSIEGAKKDKKNDFFKAKYADLSGCWDACRDALQSNNLGVLQFPCDAGPGFVGLRSTLVYGPTGETISESFMLPLKNANSAQDGGSAITYARRYALCAIIGICPEDDDGNAATGNKNKHKDIKSGGPIHYTPTAFNLNFFSANTLEAMKNIYSETKASNMAEPNKTETLNLMAKAIKAKLESTNNG